MEGCHDVGMKRAFHTLPLQLESTKILGLSNFSNGRSVRRLEPIGTRSQRSRSDRGR